MPRRSVDYLKLPWNGGINTSVSSGVLSDNDLISCDNVIFKTSGVRAKREGLSYFGNPIPAVTLRESTGTTRTLTFASDINDGSDNILVLGEKITITGPDTGDESNYVEEDVLITGVTATTITYTASGSFSEGSTAVTDLTVSRASTVYGLLDYWRLNGSGVKEQLLLAATDEFKLFRYNVAGDRLEISPDTGAEPSGDITSITRVTMNNRAIMAFDDVGDLPIMYRPETSALYQLLGGTPPDFSIMSEYLGRLWTNDKTDPDRLHYSSTGNVEEWNGTGDSGALDISPGDGDSRGITAIYAFKGILFVAKGSRLFRITGGSPENFKVEPVSDGIGCESHESAVPVDETDVMFVSRRGFHSTAATDAYGDTASTFLSTKIQPTFNDWEKDTLKKIQGAYIPTLNSVVYSVSENGATNDTVWLFNTILKEWHRWPNISCEALDQRLSATSEVVPIFGTDDGRVIQAQNGTFTDFETQGITLNIKTGTLYPGGNPLTMKMFKRIGFLYEPVGSSTFTVQTKIDNLPEQSFSFNQTANGDQLGLDFILGQSILGNTQALAPFSLCMDGYGRGITLTIRQSGPNASVEIYGFYIEFEDADTRAEVI